MLNSKSNQNYTLFYIIGFIIIFYLFIMPYFDKYNSPSPTPTFNEPPNMTAHQIEPNITTYQVQPYMTTHQIEPTMTTTYSVEPRTIQINSNNNIQKYDPHLINNELLDTQEYTNEHIKLFDKEYKPIEKLENIEGEITMNPTSIPIENTHDNPKSISTDNTNYIPKIDMNECKKSCCKHNQWLPPFMTEKPTNDYVGSNFSCNFGSGSGCVCITNNDLNFLTNRGFIK